MHAWINDKVTLLLTSTIECFRLVLDTAVGRLADRPTDPVTFRTFKPEGVQGTTAGISGALMANNVPWLPDDERMATMLESN